MSDNPSDEFLPFDVGGFEKIDPEALKEEETDASPGELETFVDLYRKNLDQGRRDAFEDLVKQVNESGKESFRPLYRQESPVEEGEKNAPSQAPAEPPPEPASQMPPSPPSPPDLEALKSQAYEEGFAMGQEEGFIKGEREGLAAGKEKTEAVLARLEGLVMGLEGLWTEMIRRNEAQILALINRIAEKVVLGHVATDRDMVKRAILETLGSIPEPVNVVIHVNAEDYETVDVAREEFFAQVEGLKRVSVVSSPGVAPGGCRIETSAGEASTDLEERLEAVRKSLVGEV